MTTRPALGVDTRLAYPRILTPEGVIEPTDVAARVRDAVRSPSRDAARVSGPGAILAFDATADADTIVTLLATWERGAIAWPLDPRLPDAARKGLLAGVPGVTVLGDGAVIGASDASADTRGSPAMPAGAATVIATSGSAGAPTRVVHTVDNHVTSADGVLAYAPMSAEDRWLLSLPLHHVSGLAILIRVMRAGVTLALPRAGASLSSALAHSGATHASVVATQLKRLLREPSSGARPRHVLVGGGPCPPRLVGDAARAGLPVSVTYGLTEMASTVTAARVDADATASPDAPRHSGRALGGRRVAISPDGSIVVGGAMLSPGALSTSGFVAHTGDDLVTDDLGSLSPDGLLTVLGRRDEMFVSGGENVHPEEIEMALLASSRVERATVIGRPDPEFGRRPVAFVTLSAPAPSTSAIPPIEVRPGEPLPPSAASELRAELAGVLPAFKLPVAFLAHPEARGLKPGRRALERWLERHDRG